MAKNSRGQKERSREQELKYENQKLRREVSSLRKQLARVDLNRFTDFQEILKEKVAQDESNKDSEHLLASMKREWECHSCKDGHLEIVVYTGPQSKLWYFRKCTNCVNRTKAQPYHAQVKGIKKVPEAVE